MTKVICFGSQKGGVGKSTLTMLVSSFLQAKGKKVFVADVDFPQHSIHRTRTDEQLNMENDPVLKAAFDERGVTLSEVQAAPISEAAGMVSVLKKANLYDYIFVDLPGTLNVDGLFKLAQSMDYFITPMEMDPVTFNSGCESLVIYHQMNPTLRMGVVWNRIKGNENRSIMEGVNAYITTEMPKVTLLRTILPDTVAMKRGRSTIYPCADKPILSLMEELFGENGFIG
jgi:chromosome partitioning protein